MHSLHLCCSVRGLIALITVVVEGRAWLTSTGQVILSVCSLTFSFAMNALHWLPSSFYHEYLPSTSRCTCVSIEQVPAGIPYVSIRECQIQEKRGMHDSQGEVLSDSTHTELDKACAELTVMVARRRNRADRMQEVYRSV